MPFFNTAVGPMSEMSGVPSIVEKIGWSQQEGYAVDMEGTAVGSTPAISAILSRLPRRAWNFPVFLLAPWGGSGPSTSMRLRCVSGPLVGRSLPPQRSVPAEKRVLARIGRHAASQAVPLAYWGGGKPL